MYIKKLFILSIIVWLLILLVYLPTFFWMKDRFLEADTNYSHGFLIPLVIGYIILSKKKLLKQMPVTSSGWGIALMVTGLLIHLVSMRLRIEFISAFSLLLTSAGAVLYLYGKDYLKNLSFPFFLYLFMVPLPTVFTVYITFNLKMVTAQIATHIVKMMGIPLMREGSTIITPNSVMVVDDQCSGIRSLISLLALGAIYSYLSSLNMKKKVILFLLAIPIAIIANVGRVVLMILASFVYGSQIINNKIFHNLTGLSVFVMAIVLLLATKRILYESDKS